MIFNVLFHFLVKSLIEQINLGLISSPNQINTRIFWDAQELKWCSLMVHCLIGEFRSHGLVAQWLDEASQDM